MRKHDQIDKYPNRSTYRTPTGSGYCKTKAVNQVVEAKHLSQLVKNEYRLYYLS